MKFYEGQTFYHLCLIFCFVDGNLAMKILKSKYTVNYGENVSLECIWNGGSLPTSFTWYKSGKAIDLDTDNRKYLGSTVHSPSLHVLNVDEKDNDTYTCVASRKFEDKLEHLESPKINLSVNILGTYFVLMKQ